MNLFVGLKSNQFNGTKTVYAWKVLEANAFRISPVDEEEDDEFDVNSSNDDDDEEELLVMMIVSEENEEVREEDEEADESLEADEDRCESAVLKLEDSKF